MIYGRYVGKYGIIQKVLREGEGSLNNKNEHRKLGWGGGFVHNCTFVWKKNWVNSDKNNLLCII